MKNSKSLIPLFYWSEIKFIFRNKENYGDLLSKYIVERVSGRKVKWVHPKKQPWYKLDKTNYLSIGSIIHHSTTESIVWGSGVIDSKQEISNADFRAVRGPQTRNLLLEKGYKCPEVFGDPAVLLPLYYHPVISKKFQIGIIPHYHDYDTVYNIYKNYKEIKVIDMMTMDIEDVTKQILQCEKTISSSLHGLIVSHAYEIPSLWVKFSDKIFGDGIKYRDYLESVGIPFYQPIVIDKEIRENEIEDLFQNYLSQPSRETIAKLQEGLLKSCPFPDPNKMNK